MLTRALIKHRAQALILQQNSRAFTVGSSDPRMDPKNHVPFESNRVMTKNRFDDEPEPKEEDQIVTHYLKHHPLYEFRDFEEFHVDGYRHWLHGRVDYIAEETYPGDISPWEMGSKVGHMFFVLLPVICFVFVGNGYKNHLKQKNVKMPIVGVFSQDSI